MPNYIMILAPSLIHFPSRLIFRIIRIGRFLPETIERVKRRCQNSRQNIKVQFT